MQRHCDRLASGSRSVVAGLAWLTPAVVLALVAERVFGGPWLAYTALLVGGGAVGVWVERARAAAWSCPPALETGPGARSGGPHVGEAEADRPSQKYLM